MNHLVEKAVQRLQGAPDAQLRKLAISKPRSQAGWIKKEAAALVLESRIAISVAKYSS